MSIDRAAVMAARFAGHRLVTTACTATRVVRCMAEFRDRMRFDAQKRLAM